MRFSDYISLVFLICIAFPMDAMETSSLLRRRRNRVVDDGASHNKLPDAHAPLLVVPSDKNGGRLMYMNPAALPTVSVTLTLMMTGGGRYTCSGNYSRGYWIGTVIEDLRIKSKIPVNNVRGIMLETNFRWGKAVLESYDQINDCSDERPLSHWVGASANKCPSLYLKGKADWMGDAQVECQCVVS